MNTTILAILLSALLCFIGGLLSKNSSYKKLLIALLVAALIALSIALCLKSRAALLGCCVSGLYILFISGYVNQRKLLIFSGLFVSTLLVNFLFIKKDSASGRRLIYKVSFSKLTAHDYLYGLGLGKFKAKYSQWQASYFTDKDANSQEALLADNAYYLFNDWLQAALEIGIIGLSILAVAVLLFFKMYRYQPGNNRWRLAANSSLICISVAALFSYPLQEPIIFLLFMLCVVLHFYHTYKVKEPFTNALFILLKNSILIVISCWSIYYSYMIYCYKRQSKEAVELYKMGYKNDAENICRKLENEQFADEFTFYNYAHLLYMRNQPTSALEKVDKAISLACNAEAVKLKADILNELKEYPSAEKYYLQAVYMVPNRMQTKYNLMQFYLQQKDTTKAKEWANNIINMKIKIPSTAIARMKRSTQELMSQLGE